MSPALIGAGVALLAHVVITVWLAASGFSGGMAWWPKSMPYAVLSLLAGCGAAIIAAGVS